ncbi:uncharacterized protein [Choristoneura fumiferana]|uniref:uncharacterized protein n=1 Tax=Choristoneura fumiferana TaxID=7141 RepID=UPI003D154959
MDKQEVKRSSKTRLWLSARRKKKGPARHKKENINPNSTLGTGEHASEQSDSDNNTDPPPQPLNLSSTLGTGEHASEQSDSDNNTDPPPQFQNFSRVQLNVALTALSADASGISTNRDETEILSCCET